MVETSMQNLCRVTHELETNLTQNYSAQKSVEKSLDATDLILGLDLQELVHVWFMELFSLRSLTENNHSMSTSTLLLTCSFRVLLLRRVCCWE